MKPIYNILYVSCLLLIICISCSNSSNKENNNYVKAIANINLGIDKKTFEKERQIFLRDYSTLSGAKIKDIEAIYYNDKVVRVLVYSYPRSIWESDSTWCNLYSEKYPNYTRHKQYIAINNGNVEILVSDECKKIYACKGNNIPEPLWECWNVDSIKREFAKSLKKTATIIKKNQGANTSKKSNQQRWQKGLDEFQADAEAFHSMPSIFNSNTFAEKFSIIDIKDKNLFNKLINDGKNKVKEQKEQEKKKSINAI